MEPGAAPVPCDRASLKTRIVELMRQASTEITVGDKHLLPALTANLPAGSGVHVARTPKATGDQVVQLSLRMQQCGLRGAPHIVARPISTQSALQSALRDMKRGGVEQSLLVAGDLEQPLGPFASALETASALAVRSASPARSVSIPPSFMNGDDRSPVTAYGCRSMSASPDRHR